MRRRQVSPKRNCQTMVCLVRGLLFLIILSERTVLCLSERGLFSSSFIEVSDEIEFNAAINDNTLIDLTSDILLTNKSISIQSISSLVLNGNSFKIDGQGVVQCFRIIESRSISIHNLSIINGYSNTTGGGFYIRTSDVVLHNDWIFLNNAKFGGGVYQSNGSLSIANSFMFENNAIAGGAALIANVFLSIVNTTISNNSVSNTGGGVVLIRLVNESIIANCHFLNNYGKEYAGGLFVQNSKNVLISNTSVSNNTAVSLGGGAVFAHASVTLTHCCLKHNFVDNEGGGLLVDTGSVNISFSDISQNVALSVGSGISAKEAMVAVSNSLFHSNGVMEGKGSAVYVQFGQVNLTNCDLVNNTAVKGGAVYATGTSTTVFLFSCMFRRNRALYGAGLYLHNGILIDLNSVFQKNHAISSTFIKINATYGPHNSSSTTVGGCIYSSNYPQKYNSDDYCKFQAFGSGSLTVYDYEIEFGYDVLSVNQISYTNNDGPQGVAIQSGDVIEWKTDSYFQRQGFEICFTNLASGGGLYVQGGELTMINSTLLDNSATQYGGALSMNGGATVLKNVLIENNIASTLEGTQIYFSGGTFLSSGMTIPGFDSTSLGGSSIQAASCVSNCFPGESGQCMVDSTAKNCYVNCECVKCAAGKFLISIESVSSKDCEGCPSGSYSLQGSANCIDCAVGQYATNNISDKSAGQIHPVLSGATTCKECPVGYFAWAAASVLCQDCQSPKTSSIGASTCDQSEEGFFILNSDEPESCPNHADCPGGYSLPIPQDGYWVDRSNIKFVTSPYRCQRYTCLSSSSSAYRPCWTMDGYYNQSCHSNELMCLKGAKGSLCGSCEDNYRYSSISLVCVKCTSMSYTYQLVMIFICLLLFFMIILVTFDYFQLPLWFWNSYFVLLFNNFIKYSSLPIIFSTYQIIESITYSMDIQYPLAFSVMLQYMTILNFDLTGFECASIGVFDRVYIASIIPIAIGVSSVLIGQFRISTQILQTIESKDLIISQHSWFLLILSYLVLPSILNKQLRALDCIILSSGESFLRMDTSVSCNSANFYFFQVIDSLLICIYLSVPFIWLYVLYQNRNHLLPHNVDYSILIEIRSINSSLTPIRFLYERYRPEMFYYEVHDIFRRIFFIGVIPLLSPSTLNRSSFGLIFSLLAMIHHRELMPYQYNNTNRLAHIANLVIFLMFLTSLFIEINISKNFNELIFGIILCCVNLTIVFVALFAAYIRTKRDSKLIAMKKEKMKLQIEWAIHFSKNKFETTIEVIHHTVIPSSHCMVFLYGSIKMIDLYLCHGIKVKTHMKKGIIFTKHHPYDLTILEKSIFQSTEAFIVCSLPKLMLIQHEGGPGSDLWCLPRNILQSLQSAYCGDMTDHLSYHHHRPHQLKQGTLLLPPQCIKRAYQIEEAMEQQIENETFNILNVKSSKDTILTTDVFSEGDVELEMQVANKDDDVETDDVKPSDVKVSVVSTITNYLDAMKSIRDQCKERNLVPVYHYTMPCIAPLILQNGFRMSTQGQGDGGVYFSTQGPACYDIGSDQYEENIIIDCFGKERLEEYRGKHKLDVCFVYGIDPMIIKNAPGGRDNAVVVPKTFFEDFSFPRSDGFYFLRPDRIFGALLIDTLKPPIGRSEALVFLTNESQLDSQFSTSNSS